jgi:hypothetical protein
MPFNTTSDMNRTAPSIVICASSSFGSEILAWKTKLEDVGYLVKKYPEKITGDLAEGYEKEFSEHYHAIAQADAIFVLNLEKKGIPGYIGPAVFAEMAFAIGLNRAINKQIRVHVLNPIPTQGVPYADELELWKTLGWITPFTQPDAPKQKELPGL